MELSHSKQTIREAFAQAPESLQNLICSRSFLEFLDTLSSTYNLAGLQIRAVSGYSTIFFLNLYSEEEYVEAITKEGIERTKATEIVKKIKLFKSNSDLTEEHRESYANKNNDVHTDKKIYSSDNTAEDRNKILEEIENPSPSPKNESPALFTQKLGGVVKTTTKEIEEHPLPQQPVQQKTPEPAPQPKKPTYRGSDPYREPLG